MNPQSHGGAEFASGLLSTRWRMVSLLLGAVLWGTFLRFVGLAARQMSTDEAATWTAAAAPTISEVARLQAELNPGKLAAHEVLLHGWIMLFGQDLFALRALSALLGSLAIGLVFLVAREMLAPPPVGADRQRENADALAGLSALVFAVNLVTIKYAREARMYPLVLVVTLLQVTFFLRGLRYGGLWTYGGVALFTALAMAANFSAALILAPEGIWLLYLAWPKRKGTRTDWNRCAAIAASLALGIALLAPFSATFRSNASALSGGILYWVKPPPLWEPFAFFNKATGSFAFPVMAALAGWGVVRGWRRAPELVAFALLWMWLPVILLMGISYGYEPVFVERYALGCFVPFFILVAVGIGELRSLPAAASALALVVVLSLGHIAAYYRKPHEVQWREAAALVTRHLKTVQPIVVAPEYGFRVLRYYLPPGQRDLVFAAADATERAPVLIMADRDVSPAERARLSARYPRLLGRLRGVEVRER